MAGSVVYPITKTTGSWVAWMMPKSRDMAKTIPIGKVGSVGTAPWLSKTPLDMNMERAAVTSEILYVTLLS